jgi:hypothetical protein
MVFRGDADSTCSEPDPYPDPGLIIKDRPDQIFYNTEANLFINPRTFFTPKKQPHASKNNVTCDKIERLSEEFLKTDI